MKILKTLSATIAGTTCMTLFSYVLTATRKKQFKEPVLLHRLLKRGLWPGLRKRNGQGGRFDGWLLHYATGLLFSATYDRIWEKTKMAPTVPAGITLGAVSGLVGVSIWSITFKMHPNPPEVDRKELYKHLLLAHIVFGMFAAAGYRAPDDITDRRGGFKIKTL